MSNIHEDAFRGTLTTDLLKRYLSDDASIIDSPGGRKSLTPLAAATLRGHLDVVNLLLENPIRRADPDALSDHNRTPLFLATSRSPPHDRGSIVRLLLDNGADVDLCYADDNYNTPLMNAIIEIRDREVVHELVDCGASLFRENAAGETAMTLAKKVGMEADLRSRNERTSSRAKSRNERTSSRAELSNSSRVLFGSRTMIPPQVEDTFFKNTELCLDGRIIRESSEVMGYGGFADVYQGLLEDRKVAIKVVRHFGIRQEKLLRRLWREYLAWSDLSHPNILACLGYAFDFSSGPYALPSLISPWMENGTCLPYLETHPDADRLDLLIGIGCGLHHLHTREPVIVHGDIRAGNILVSDQGVPCLTDFGLSRVLEEIKGMTTSTDIAGSLRWMSPELLNGNAVNIQSDVWAYGMTILEILTGQRPYLEVKLDPIVIGLVSKGEVPSRPRGVDGQESIDDEVWAACRRCWSFNPTARPSINAVVTMIMRHRPPSNPSSSNASLPPAILDTPLATRATNDPRSDDYAGSDEYAEGSDDDWAVHHTAPSSVSSTALPSQSVRDSIPSKGLRKPPTTTGTIAMSAPTQIETSARNNLLSMLSSSKPLKFIARKPFSTGSPKKQPISTSSSNLFKVDEVSASSGQSLSPPSPTPSGVDEELLGDEEIMACIKRQQSMKLANGAKNKELDKLLNFPEPSSPVTAKSPSAVLTGSLGAHLSLFEREEILDYPAVHYVGQGSRKKPATVEASANNHGYDDERGDYLAVNHDHLAYRYEVIDTLGKGSFGQVLHCRDHATGTSVAIKIIRNKKRFHHQALVEIKTLENLRKWDPDDRHHVIKMTDHFYFRNHLCIAMELLSINLYELIKANGFFGFTTNLIRRFTSQMLASLAFMHQHRIIHCDFKPENVLLCHPAKSGIKIVDFGNSCFEHEKVYTYIQSRFYRSPEVILGMNYHMAIDMWSLGCILAELYTGFPIFPGENEQEQLSCIMEILGVPEKDFINRSSRKRLFFDSAGAPRPVVNSKGRRRRPGTRPLAQFLRCNDELFLDFIAKCLIWDPERRLKPQPAMRHPFLTAVGNTSVNNNSSSTTPTNSLLSSTSSPFGSNSQTASKETETPKRSRIGAPTPPTKRDTLAPTTTTTVTQTPVGSDGLHSLGPYY